MNEFRILSETDIRNKIGMAKAIELMKDAFVQISKQTATVPVRTALDSTNANGRVLYMPAYSPTYKLFGVKMVGVFPENAKLDLPSIQGQMLVMDDDTGSPRGLIEAEYLTSLRTGAASGLATDLLALPQASVLAIFGTGAQAETQVEAILQVRSIQTILVFATTNEKAEKFCQHIQKNHNVICEVGSPEKLKEADVICAATTSSQPLFQLHHLKQGVHINGIGSYKPEIREIPGEVIKEALLIVDHGDSALSEAGDIIIPLNEGHITAAHIHAELGELITGSKKGRANEKQITVFKSVGNAVQDLALAAYLLH